MDSGVGSGVDNSDAITFGIDDEYNMDPSDYSFYGLNFVKPEMSNVYWIWESMTVYI